MQLSRPTKIIVISLILLIGVILLSSIIYYRTSLWKPEQHLIALLPQSPICYLTLKELKAFVDTFNRSEFGKQAAEMPILAEIKEERWWKQFIYQKQLWEYEMGGKLDLKAITGYFGEETVLALYQREGELSFLLLTAVGAQEKLSIEALTATDAINPQYQRLQNEYGDFTINTIVGYPREFSYTFIGKIGVLSLDPLLVAETLDIYNGFTNTASAPKTQNFLADHPIATEIQKDYQHGKSTGYVDIPQLLPLLENLNSPLLTEQVLPRFATGQTWTFSNRYEEGVIVSDHRFQRRADTEPYNVPEPGDAKPFLAFPENTMLSTTFRLATSIQALFGDIDLSEVLGTDVTALLTAPGAEAGFVIPSVTLIAAVKDSEALTGLLDLMKQGKPTLAGKPLEYLEPQEHNGATFQPLQLRLNFLLAVTGGYALVDDYFVLSTTLDGVKSLIDTVTRNAPVLKGAGFTAAANGPQVFVQPERLVPALERFLPVLTTLASFSGYKLDATLTQQIKENLSPLEALGPISATVNYTERSVQTEVRIVLEE